MDKLEFLTGGEPPVDATPPAQDAPVSEGPARGPDGRFAPSEPAPQPEPTPEPVLTPEPAPAPVAAQPVVSPPAEPGFVPISGLLDEREKRQAAERRAEEAERRAQAQAAQPPPAQQDYWEDPQGYTQQAVLNAKLDMSEMMARGTHGDDVVNAARDWVFQKAATSPAFGQEVLSQRHPYDYAVQAYQRDQMLAQVQPADFAAFQAWRAAQAQAATLAPAASAAIPQPVAAPPRSLASATSAGGAAHVPTGDGQAFDALFKR